MGSARFSVKTPEDYLLHRDACSYGYFLLEPNHWEPSSRTMARVLDLGGPVLVTVRQPGSREGASLRVEADRRLSAKEREAARGALTRMLNLHEGAETIAEFHRVDGRWKRSGRGRLSRSPSLFEDVIKTVTSCNVTWPSTVNMNRRLCEVIGGGAFPSAKTLARTRPQTLRARCGVGYRDQRIVELAKMFADGRIDAARIEGGGMRDEELFEELLEWPGVGPYAAANIMQLVGRYSRLPLDSESLRHGRTVLGYRGTDRAVMKRLGRHYEPFGAHRFRSYWFELWAFYEGKRGRSWTWRKEEVGKSFTSALLK